MEKPEIDQEHIVDVEELVNHLEKEYKEEIKRRCEKVISKIPRVPEKLLAVESNKHCFVPRVVSIGPYHHGKPGLESMEKLKINFAGQFVFEVMNGFSLKELHKRVRGLVVELRKCYTADSTERFDDLNFTKLMLLDACFVLYFIYCVTYGKNKDLKIRSHEIASVHRDLLLLENQLPWKLLCSILEAHKSPLTEQLLISFWTTMSPIGSIFYFVQIQRIPKDISDLHISFDHFWGPPTSTRMSMCETRQITRDWYVRRSAKDLRFAGISFKPSTTTDFTDAKFKSKLLSGVLTLPSLVIDDSTESKLLNLVAYEMVSDNVSKIGVTSYICFLNSLIGHVDDVKHLRLAGVLFNFLSNDAEAVKLINKIAGDLVLDQDDDNYLEVNLDIAEYFSHGRKTKVATWIAEVLRDHFRTPWTAIIVFAAMFTIVLSIIQTYFTVFPASHDK